jgi:hypothetical protein
MGFVDGPLREALEKEAEGAEELLKVRAWEVEESPTDLGYRPVDGWPRLPEGWRLGQVVGVATDSRGRYYIYHRGDQAPPIICFDREGELIASWGEGSFGRPHMIKCDRGDNLWAVDDGGHVLYLYSPRGEVLRTLGAKDAPGEDGGHFNRPTDIAFGQDGGFYVSDGYGNRRVARFDGDLRFMGQWGSEGEGEGQFILPHAVTTDPEGLVYVADRTKWRVEVFTPEGVFLGQWTHIGKPYGIIYADDGCFYVCDGDNARVTKLDRSGRILGFFGEKGSGPGQLSTAHDIAIAENGDILTAHLYGRVQLFSLS